MFDVDDDDDEEWMVVLWYYAKARQRIPAKGFGRRSRARLCAKSHPTLNAQSGKHSPGSSQ